MHDFFKMMRQYASPYKGYLAGAVVLNMLSAIFNIFSFAVIIPLLNILFKVDTVAKNLSINTHGENRQCYNRK